MVSRFVTTLCLNVNSFYHLVSTILKGSSSALSSFLLFHLTLSSSFVGADQFGSLSPSYTALEIMLAVETLQIAELGIALLIVVITTPAAAIVLIPDAPALDSQIILLNGSCLSRCGS